jgi:hypothetical protein
MCDYSLELYRAVPAVAGEQYTLARFASGSMGFTSGKTCDTAVCVPADAHLRLEGISETLQRTLNVGAIAEVVMTRLDSGPHKDAVRFADGKVISLQSLNPGLTATLFVPAARDLIKDIEVHRAVRELIDA